MSIRSYWENRTKNLLIKGKIFFLSPYKIEKQSILDSLVEAKKYASGNILDMGCGNKPYSDIYAGIDGKYTGIDLPAFQSANKEEKRADVYGSVLELPYKSDSFETVITLQVIEHIPEPNKMLKEARRAMKKDGHLILTAPMTLGLHEIPHDYYRYTRYGLKYLAKSVGFEIIYIRQRYGFWGIIGQRLSNWLYHLGGAPGSLTGEMIKRSLCAAIQLFYLALDNWMHRKETPWVM